MRIKNTIVFKKVKQLEKVVSETDLRQRIEDLIESDNKKVRTTLLLLGILSLPILFTVAVTAPNLFSAMGRIRSDSSSLKNARFRSALQHAQKSRYVKTVHCNNEEIISLTPKGKQYLHYHLLQKLRVTRPKIWDKKWRLVIFDISNEKTALRDFLRRKLKELHFLQIQRSVFLSPWPSRREIEFLKQALRLRREIQFMEVVFLEDEEYWKSSFKIR